MALKKPLRILGLEINKTEILGFIVGLVIVVLDFIFIFENKPLFYFILGIAFVIVGFPFFLFLVFETNKMREKESMFLEFSRNLVENVRAGTPISRAILNVKTKDYRSLNPHVQKLANQISLGIPIQTAFYTFARDIRSETITRAVTIISESEKAGGQIEDILDSVVKSVSQIEKLRKERRASIYTLVVQGYIIFLIFIVIIIVMEFQILPIATGLGDTFGEVPEGDVGELADFLGKGGNTATPEELARPFLFFLIVQGFFTGLIIGKLSEGKILPGLKHSFIFIVLAILIDTGAKVLLGTPGGATEAVVAATGGG